MDISRPDLLDTYQKNQVLAPLYARSSTGGGPLDSLKRGAVLLIVVSLLAASAPALAGGPALSPPQNDSDAREGRAPSKPDHAGPYNVGYMYETLYPSTKSYSVQVKLFYPAQSAGQDTTANTAGAPYPTVVHLTGFGGGVESLNGVLTRVASWGFVSAMLEVNWNDWPSCANISDMNDLLDRLEEDNASSSHRLRGMMDKENFGIHGYSSGGGICLVDCTYVPRLKAACSWASAIDNSYTDVLAQTFNKPVQLQAGEYDSGYAPNAYHAYQVFPPPKVYLTMTGGNHQGPYSYDGMISFFIRYLYHDAAYDTYLYGEGAMSDAADLTYALNFTLPNGSFFPPNILVTASKTLVVEDEAVDFNLSHDGYLPVGHPEGSFKWDLNGDGLSDPAAPNSTEASSSYDRAGVIRPSAWFELGKLRLRMNRTLALTVTNPPPVVELGGNLATTEDTMLDFTAEVNDTPSDNGKLQFAWDLGDGWSLPYKTSLAASHSYRNAGNYTVRLSVKDDEGAETSDSIIVTVANVIPTALAPSNLTVDKDEELSFIGSGTDTASDKDKLQYRWTFGDGSQRDWSSDPTAVHTYTRSGNLTAVFEVQDDEGALAQCPVAVRVIDGAPVPSITAPRFGDDLYKDEQIDFGGTAADSPTDQPYLQFSWDFGDQNSTDWANRAAATHAYTRGGKYTVVLRCRDPDGVVGETSRNITVINQAPEVSILSPVSGQAQEDEKVVFRAEGTDTPSDIDSLNYTWVIDGESFFGERIERAFTTEGPHSYAVTVTDAEGETAVASGSVDVANAVPKLSASLFPETIYANESVGFSASAQDTASDRSALSFWWDFGDGATSNETSGTHVFTRPGTFTVKVAVSDDEGAERSSSFTVTVNARPVVLPPPGDDDGTTVQTTGPGAYLLAAGLVAAICIVASVLLLWRRKRRG